MTTKTTKTTKTTTTAATSPARHIPRSVPDEQRLAIIGAQGTDTARARGLVAAGANSPEERRAILSGNADVAPTPAPARPPYRPVGRPPWGEP
jgi:hypothetical protein